MENEKHETGFEALMNAPVMPKVDTRNIRAAIMDGRKMRCVPANVWRQFSDIEQFNLLFETGTYVAPTEELIDYLDELIGEEKTIEICAGNGWVGRELDLVLTDSYQQAYDKKSVQMYQQFGQPLIKYPKDVIKLEASDAVLRLKPHTVLACFGTHKYRADVKDGNYKGVDYVWLLTHCKRIILVGNKEVHHYNPIMSVAHEEIALDGLITRSSFTKNRNGNRIFVWQLD
jgi:hypothetical protein